jgi:hypothetical protein
MTLRTSLHRWTLATLLVAVGVATFAPMAQADQGWRRYKHVERGPWRDYGHSSYRSGYRGAWGGPRGVMVFRERDHGGGMPLIAGLVGGMILGSVLQSHSQPVVVHDRYCPPQVIERQRYYEPQVVEPQRERDYEPPAVEQQRDRDDEQQAQPAPVYRYEDGNGERWWDTLDECTDAARGARGPKVIKVVDDRTNELVKTLYWSHDHWISDQDRDN